MTNSQPTFHYEYTNIHNQRIALVNTIHVWHQIGFPASLVVFAFLFKLGFNPTREGNLIFVWGGFVSSLLIVLFVRLVAYSFDHQVVRLYPRLIALEIILGYHFYRSYLKGFGEEERKFVEACELSYAPTANVERFWRECDFKFCPKRFPSRKRGHLLLNLAALALVLGFLITAAAATYFARSGSS